MNLTREIVTARRRLRLLKELVAIRQDIHVEEIKLIECSDARIICGAVCQHCQKTLPEVRCKRRDEEYVWPRFIILHLLRENTPLSLQQIAEQLRPAVGDHGTVLHGLRRFQERLSIDPAFRMNMSALETSVRNILDNARESARPAQ